MKTLRTVTTSLALALTALSPALAAGGREDHSGILVWAFLGLCALIVVAQVVPAILMSFGMMRGLAPARKHAEEAAHGR